MTVDYAQLYQSFVQIAVNEAFPKERRGRPTLLTFRTAFSSMQEIMRTGMPWRCLKPDGVSHITVFKALHRWSNAGVFKTAYTRLLKLYASKRGSKYFALDSTFVKNMYGRDVVGRNPTDRGRKATKMSVAVDDIGVPHAFFFSGANVSDFGLMERTLDASLVPLRRDVPLYADKGYDSRANHALCRRKYGLQDRLFRRRSDWTRRTHAKRGVVERFFAWNDKQRRLLVRYEQKLTIYESFMLIFSGNLLARKMKMHVSV